MGHVSASMKHISISWPLHAPFPLTKTRGRAIRVMFAAIGLLALGVVGHFALEPRAMGTTRELGVRAGRAR